jgi:hypothetical protein
MILLTEDRGMVAGHMSEQGIKPQKFARLRSERLLHQKGMHVATTIKTPLDWYNESIARVW